MQRENTEQEEREEKKEKEGSDEGRSGKWRRRGTSERGKRRRKEVRENETIECRLRRKYRKGETKEN